MWRVLQYLDMDEWNSAVLWFVDNIRAESRDLINSFQTETL
jgi:hypothetical protein